MGGERGREDGWLREHLCYCSTCAGNQPVFGCSVRLRNFEILIIRFQNNRTNNFPTFTNNKKEKEKPAKNTNKQTTETCTPSSPKNNDTVYVCDVAVLTLLPVRHDANKDKMFGCSSRPWLRPNTLGIIYRSKISCLLL